MKIVKLSVVAVVAASLLTAAQPVEAAACPAPIPAVAHRGGTENYAENSRNAFRRAENIGVPLWEADARVDADGHWWVLHDETVDRVTDGTGRLDQMTTAQVRQLRTADGQPLLALDDLANDVAVDRAKLFLELKITPTAAQWASLLAILDRHGIRSRVILTSFDPATLLAARQHAPDLATGRIYNPQNVDPADALQYGRNLIIHHNSITDARITAWAAAGLDVYAWTVNSVSEWDRMQWYRSNGRLDGVITDLPAGYLAWAASRRC